MVNFVLTKLMVKLISKSDYNFKMAILSNYSRFM